MSDHCLFNKEFPITCFNSNDSHIDILDSVSFRKHEIYEYWLVCMEKLIKRKWNYSNDFLAKRIQERIENIRFIMNDSIEYKIFLRLNTILLHIEQGKESKNNAISNQTVKVIFNFLNIVRRYSKTEQSEYIEDIDLSFCLLISLGMFGVHISELVDRRNDFFIYLESFQKQFYEKIFHCLFYILDKKNLTHIQDNDEFFERVENVKINQFDTYLHPKIKHLFCLLNDIFTSRKKDVYHEYKDKVESKTNGIKFKKK